MEGKQGRSALHPVSPPSESRVAKPCDESYIWLLLLFRLVCEIQYSYRQVRTPVTLMRIVPQCFDIYDMSPGLATLLLTEVGTEEEEEEDKAPRTDNIRRRRPPLPLRSPEQSFRKWCVRGDFPAHAYCVCAERTTTADFKVDKSRHFDFLALSFLFFKKK